MSKYSDYDFQPFLKEAVAKLGFEAPTPIQKEMIPLILRGRSAIGQAHTGTGKTHSFLLPIVQRMQADRSEVQAIITTPTRELATQIYAELQKLIEGTALTSRLLIGGTDKARAIERLKTQPHIVVGTPGRIRDLVKEGALLVHTAPILVVDEADLAFDLGFIQEIDEFASRMPDQLEMYVFSATIPEKLQPFLKKYMDAPVHIELGVGQALASGVTCVAIPTRGKSRKNRLFDVLRSLNPYLAIVFANTRQHADEVANFLAAQGIRAGVIHGDLTPRERKRTMKQALDLEFQYIVATDLAARGIDIPGVSHVINYEIPDDLEFFIHRVGRTARAGNKGMAITLYDPSEEDKVVRIEKMGVTLLHKDVVDGELVDLKERHSRKNRTKDETPQDARIKSIVRKPAAVKPAYKKKMKWKMDAIKKRERRLNRRSNEPKGK